MFKYQRVVYWERIFGIFLLYITVCIIDCPFINDSVFCYVYKLELEFFESGTLLFVTMLFHVCFKPLSICKVPLSFQMPWNDGFIFARSEELAWIAVRTLQKVNVGLYQFKITYRPKLICSSIMLHSWTPIFRLKVLLLHKQVWTPAQMWKYFNETISTVWSVSCWGYTNTSFTDTSLNINS
jgi:hypothetical protein